MLAIKLQRIGKKHQPSYRLVVAEKRSKMAAPPVEYLGSYNPSSKAVTVNNERVEYWMKNGAQPTITAHNLLVEKGVLTAPKRVVKMKKKEVPAEEEVKAAAPAAEAGVEAAKEDPAVAEAPAAAEATTEMPTETPAEAAAPETPPEVVDK